MYIYCAANLRLDFSAYFLGILKCTVFRYKVFQKRAFVHTSNIWRGALLNFQVICRRSRTLNTVLGMQEHREEFGKVHRKKGSSVLTKPGLRTCTCSKDKRDLSLTLFQKIFSHVHIHAEQVPGAVRIPGMRSCTWTSSVFCDQLPEQRNQNQFLWEHQNVLLNECHSSAK